MTFTASSGCFGSWQNPEQSPDLMTTARRGMTRWSGSRRVMSDKRGTMSAGRERIAELVETMMTADSLRLTACGQQIPVTQKETPDAGTSFQIVDSRF